MSGFSWDFHGIQDLSTLEALLRMTSRILADNVWHLSGVLPKVGFGHTGERSISWVFSVQFEVVFFVHSRKYMEIHGRTWKYMEILWNTMKYRTLSIVETETSKNGLSLIVQEAVAIWFPSIVKASAQRWPFWPELLRTCQVYSGFILTLHDLSLLWWCYTFLQSNVPNVSQYWIPLSNLENDKHCLQQFILSI